MASADKITTTVIKTEVKLTLTEDEAKALFALCTGVACSAAIYSVCGALAEVLGGYENNELFGDVFDVSGEVYAKRAG